MTDKNETLCCPDCGTENVIVYEKHAVMANSFEHYCFSVKAHDANAEAECLNCDWTGERHQLKKHGGAA